MCKRDMMVVGALDVLRAASNVPAWRGLHASLAPIRVTKAHHIFRKAMRSCADTLHCLLDQLLSASIHSTQHTQDATVAAQTCILLLLKLL